MTIYRRPENQRLVRISLVPRETLRWQIAIQDKCAGAWNRTIRMCPFRMDALRPGMCVRRDKARTSGRPAARARCRWARMKGAAMQRAVDVPALFVLVSEAFFCSLGGYGL
ncbi:protein of unknown function [Burkholderia multivorans]